MDLTQCSEKVFNVWVTHTKYNKNKKITISLQNNNINWQSAVYQHILMFKLKKLWCLIVLLLYAVTLIEILTVFVPDKLFSLSLSLSSVLLAVLY